MTDVSRAPVRLGFVSTTVHLDKWQCPWLTCLDIMPRLGTKHRERVAKPMTEPKSILEAAAVYDTAVIDLQQPLILQQEGQPLAVIVSFGEYQRLRALAADEVQRRQAGWQTLAALLADIQQRPTTYTTEQIEAEIGAARAEVSTSWD